MLTHDGYIVPSREPAVAPRWVDGAPENLLAAALDALEWLELIKRLNDAGRWPFSQRDSRKKLDRCIAALREHIRSAQC
jgi:hypothetical protein